MAAGRGHIRRRGDAWEVRAYAGNGRRVTKTVHGTEKQARVELTAMLARIDEGEMTAGRHTFAEAFDRWAAAKRAAMSPGTAMTTQDFGRRYLVPRIGKVRVDRLGADDLDQLYAELAAAGGRAGRGLAPATVARCAGIVHAVLEACRRWRWVTRNVADDVEPIAQPAREHTSPEAPVAAALVAAAAEQHEPDFGLYLRLAAILGSRRGETCGLRWSAIDLDAAKVTINRRLIAGRDADGHEVVYERPGTKAGRGRPVALDEHTVTMLRALRRRQAERALLHGVRPPVDGFVFSYAPDLSAGWKPHTVSQRFRRFRDRLVAGDERSGLAPRPEMAGVRLHDLRHFVASHLLDAGLPNVVVAQRVGHSSTRTTEDRYGHAVTATDRLAADILAAALGPSAASSAGR